MAGLDDAVDVNVLTDAFIPFGQIVDVTMPKSDVQSSGESHRGFGYVEYELAVDAKEAIENMDQSELYGRVIKVAQANPQKHASESLGSKTAVWEQEGYLATYAAPEISKGASRSDKSVKERGLPEAERSDTASV